MHKYIMDMLECPDCHHELIWSIQEETEDRIINGIAECSYCQATYPIKDEIAVFLTPDLPINDLWSQSENHFKKYLREHPDINERFMSTPNDKLYPADLFVKAYLLEETNPTEATKLMNKALKGIYTEDYIKGRDLQLEYIVNNIKTDDPIVDLASGRGTLVEQLAKNVDNYLIATDFSPLILKKDKAIFNDLDLDEKISFLSFDARRTPFKNGAVKILTTFVGLPNIEKPMELLHELRRIIGGKLLAINHFYPKDDIDHQLVIKEMNMETFLYQGNLIKAFEVANFKVENNNITPRLVKPTPLGKFFNFRIDGLPIKDTTLSWCVTCAK